MHCLLQTLSMQPREVLAVPDGFCVAWGCSVCCLLFFLYSLRMLCVFLAVSVLLGDALAVTEFSCSLEKLCLLQTVSMQPRDTVSIAVCFHAAWRCYVCYRLFSWIMETF